MPVTAVRGRQSGSHLPSVVLGRYDGCLVYGTLPISNLIVREISGGDI
jgi:hypothetical protein